MSKQIKFAFLFFLVLVCLTVFATTDITLTITGVVITSDGMAVPNSAVEAVRLPGEKDVLTANQLHWFQADNEGKFRLTLTPGRYEIRAKDESDGYPDPNFLLSSDSRSSFPVISIENRDLTEVKVKLGAKGGIIEGELLDQATRLPVEKGKVIIADARNPKIFVEVPASKSGHFRFAVPYKPLQISGSASGYRAASFDEKITLAGGEHRQISLELVPK